MSAFTGNKNMVSTRIKYLERHQLSKWHLPIAVFILAQIIALLVSRQLEMRVQSEAQTRFEAYTRHIENGIQTKVNAHLSILYGFRGLFAVVGIPTDAQFAKYAGELEGLTGEYGNVNFAQYIDARETKSFEEFVNNHGGSEIPRPFKIYEGEHQQPYRLVIRYGVGTSESIVNYGKDMVGSTYTPGLHRIMMEKGEIFGSGRAFKDPNEKNGLGIGFRLPLFKGGWAEGRKAPEQSYYGSIGLGLYPTVILKHFIPDQDFKFLALTIETLPYVEGSDALGPPVVIYKADKAKRAHATLPLFKRVAEIEIGQRPLRLTFEAPEDQFKDVFSRQIYWTVHGIGILIGLLLAALAYTFTLTREKLQQELAQRSAELKSASEQLTQLLAEKLSAQELIAAKTEEERQRLGKDLHDNLGQKLTGASLLMESLLRSLPKAARSDTGHQILMIVEECIGAVRTIAHGMSPLKTENVNLAEALRTLCGEYEAILADGCVLTMEFDTELLKGEEQLHLYRITQEAFTNAIRHGKATRVEVAICDIAGRPSLSITDNGKGVVLDYTEGLGIQSMRSRAQLMGLSFGVANNPFGGVIVKIGG